MKRFIQCAVIAVFLGGVIAPQPACALEVSGIVYEAEAISTPDDAWARDKRTADRWMLWTKEDLIEKKRSGGAVLVSPGTKADRATPEDGAPPLHSVVADLKPGTYSVYASAPGGRPLAYSLDRKTWRKHSGRELALGTHALSEGRFELWVDDRYAHPAGNPGPGYYDYIRFVPVPASAVNVERHEAWRGLDPWLNENKRGFAVPAVETTDWVGFEKEGDRIKGSDKGSSFSYTFDRAGTFHMAVSMHDDVDGMELLTATLKGKEVGCIVAERPDARTPLFTFKEALTVSKGDTLTFTCQTTVGCYRVYALYFAKEPIVPPPPAIENLAAWSPEAGAADLCWTTSSIATTGFVEYGVGDFAQKTPPSTYRGRNHRMHLRELDAAKEYQARVVWECQGKPLRSSPVKFRAAPSTEAATQAQVIPLSIPEPTSAARTSWPATVGVPFAQGVLADPADIALYDGKHQRLPLQADLFSRWHDGSVKWATLSFLADTDSGGEDVAYTVETKSGGATESPAPSVKRTESAEAWHITNGAVAFDIPKDGSALFSSLGADANGDGHIAPEERLTTAPKPSQLVLTLADGTPLVTGPPEAGSFRFDSNGAVRGNLTWSGPMIAPDGKPQWSYLVRLTLWKGLPAMGINASICNDQAEPRFRAIESLSITVPMDRVTGASLDGAQPAPLGDEQGLRLLQDRDNHFSLRKGEETTEGTRASGLAVVQNERLRVAAHTRDFWQTYPKGYAVTPDALHIDLLPKLPEDAYTAPEDDAWFYKLYAWCRDGHYLLRGGQLTQHDVFLYFGKDDPATAAQWFARPLLPQAPPAYLCGTGVLGRALFPRTEGLWDSYDKAVEAGFAASMKDREARRTYGWMHYGDWYGERYANFGNNEYSMDWALGVEWMRTGDRRYFDRGLEMARHYSTVDTLHGAFTSGHRGLVWEHCFNHVGTDLSLDELRIPPGDKGMHSFVKTYRSSFRGWLDPQGHIFEDGNWLYAALTGDPWLRSVAERVCTHQSEKRTPAFNFTIERCGGWPLINATAAYRFSGDPFHLNTARIIVERAFEREDPIKGGWPHTPPKGETGGVAVVGGKAFAVGVLTHGLMRYLEIEPRDRPDVRAMLVRGADWLMNESWNPGKGFRYITNAENHRDGGSRGISSLLNAEIIAFAYEETGDKKYLDFWQDMMAGQIGGRINGMGKSFTQSIRQTIYGLDRIRAWGINTTDVPEGE